MQKSQSSKVRAVVFPTLPYLLTLSEESPFVKDANGVDHEQARLQQGPEGEGHLAWPQWATVLEEMFPSSWLRTAPFTLSVDEQQLGVGEC